MKKNNAVNGKASGVFSDGSSLERFLKKYATQFRSLTPSEREVLRLIATGTNPRNIARQLNIDIKTVGNYRGSIHKKLAVKNETDCIKYALAFGLISF